MGSIPSNVSSARLMCGANPHPHSNKLKKGDLNLIENIQYTQLILMEHFVKVSFLVLEHPTYSLLII